MSNKNGSNWIRKRKRRAIYARDGWDCVYCRSVFPLGTDLTLDHIVPRSQGGTNDHTNLVTACFPCNSARQDAPLDRIRLGRALRAVARALVFEEQLELSLHL